MNIILVSGRLAKARTITLGVPQFVVLGMGAFLAVIMLAGLLHYLALRFAVDFRLPYFENVILSAQQQQNAAAAPAPAQGGT